MTECTKFEVLNVSVLDHFFVSCLFGPYSASESYSVIALPSVQPPIFFPSGGHETVLSGREGMIEATPE